MSLDAKGNTGNKRQIDLVNDETLALRLLAYCQSHNWAGPDPYDALNSKIVEVVPLFNRRIPRLVVTHLLKRSRVDIRRILLVAPTQNPRALGLFLMSLLKLSKLGLLNGNGEDQLWSIVARLEALRSRDTRSWCWGYSFAWQTRTLLVPRGCPNLVWTTFVANALLDAYEQSREPRLLEMAFSAAEHILNDLFWSDAGSVAGFAYPLASMRHTIHNGNFLGAALLCRIAKHSDEKNSWGRH